MVIKYVPVQLKTGETVELAAIQAPDEIWADRIEPRLRHKGEPWVWQNHGLLRQSVGVDARFYVLHRAGVVFATLLLAASRGVALLGHVWTAADDRQRGASGVLMAAAVRDFRHAGGRAVYLETEPGGIAAAYYARRGFEPVENGSGTMALYLQPKAELERNWFATDGLCAEPLDWRHWPAAAPLSVAEFPVTVRLAAVGLFGRRLNEQPFLLLLREQARRAATGGGPAAAVLSNGGGAVVGMASRMPDPLWPGREILDVYCHPDCWTHAATLVSQLAGVAGSRCSAYSEAGNFAKESLLQALGFRRVGTLPEWLETSPTRRVAVNVWEAAS